MNDETPKKTVEAWAIEKGFCEFVRVVDPGGRKPAIVMQRPNWRFAAIKACSRWPAGLEVTEQEFAEAAERALSIALK